MTGSEVTPRTEDGANESEEPLGVKLLPAGVQQRSTRDLQKCVKADLINSIDPKLLERLRQEAKREPPPARNGQSQSR
jgi:hypothetical protein